MAENLTHQVVRKILRKELNEDIDRFAIIKFISNYIQSNQTIGQELVLRLLSRKHELIGYETIIDSLVRQVGLFPYIEQDNLSIKDSIAYELHKPEGLADNIVFHHAQAEVYYSLIQNENIVLSAPTSFGKSLIIDAVIATKKYTNLAIIVPTIALIDETRKRLSKFKEDYKVITHPSQEPQDKNILILTQERALDIVDKIPIDFFVIDEFYKLSPNKSDTERCHILNHVFYKLVKQGAQFYLLGPNIERITTELLENVKYRFIKTDYKTVVSERHKVIVKKGETPIDKLMELVSSLSEPTLIFCQSPASANRVANSLYENTGFQDIDANDNLIDWIKDNYHEDWILPNCLKKGIGIHHGKIPRAIAQKNIKLFNEGKINYLICTSTIIEGVNTKAKNVIIYDNKIARSKFDYFTFNNICGRSGRMFAHFIGHIYLFHEPPVAELPLVDFPIFSQNDDVPESLLINLKEEDLKESSKQKLQKYFTQDLLSREVLSQNSFIELDKQIGLAKYLDEKAQQLRPYLTWDSVPSNTQLKFACNLIWDYFINTKKRIYGVSSGNQLHFRLNQYREAGSLKRFILNVINSGFDFKEKNEGIELAFDIQRHWINFQFPRYLMALNNIVNAVYEVKRFELPDYSHYASMVECYFTEPYVVPLDEYGLPMTVSLKVGRAINLEKNIDASLAALKTFNPESVVLKEIEKEFIYELKEYI
ncbi:helicase-related protein [Prolixibacteraceae bacterium Z1-6]|uniref:Helicase-related protein n=1 Tax=Draconibacterium aestuarii TaxID=2998507 RepID=A0A9X3J789_9BACT|nr:helicase-related protein [Prolixibacteraceae bacterium Z1-6]